MACELDGECSDGLRCLGSTCRPGVSGDSCDLDADCVEGFRCIEATCSGGARGDACRTNDDCREPGLRCGVSGGSYRLCVGPGGVSGDGCERNGDCGGGLVCYQEWGSCDVPS